VGPVYRIKFGSKFGDGPDCLGPDQDTYLKSKDPLLVSAYKRSLEIAKELGAKTIGFTLLSAGRNFLTKSQRAGVFRGERALKDILEIGVKAVIDNIYPGLEAVTMVAFTQEEQQELTEVVDRILP
jgi:O-acetyl-ADP-ribose deacetylase (regulator of RNase III)